MSRPAWRNFGSLSLAMLCVAWQSAAFAQQSSWVKTGVTGRLIYVPDGEGDRIPDFSMAGYADGKQPIPTNIPVVVHVNPIAGDNTQNIQNAINFASSQRLQASGFRGVVELGPGKFDVNGHLSITASGVVLRGSGSGDDLATNTHIVSQNRTDSFDSASTPVINIQGSSSGTTRGPQIQILDIRVPVGAQSFRVASTSGMSVGSMVEIFRPSTQAWIDALGMSAMPTGFEWHAGDRDLDWQRTITRIEGNRIFIDAPITTAIDTQWGGGTVRTYNAPNVIRNVGVEKLRGQSLDTREETNEVRTPSFVRFTRADDGFVRDVETRHFPYASVFTSEVDGSQHITVDNVHSALPSGAVTGGRRYTFAMDGQYSLVKNSTADSGRHDFVTGSDVVGPIVFYNSTTSNTKADSGPHHRWGNGLLFDNIDVNGNAINVQNRWTSGSGHGWAGANVVIWNSEANSFIAQSPPTAQSWLIGSTGTINAGDCHLGGATCAGFVESHGTKVTVGGKQSLYEAQLSDAADIREFHWSAASGSWDDPAKWNQGLTPGVYAVNARDYLIGDYDNYVFNSGNATDQPYINPAWQSAIAASSTSPIVGLDSLAANQNVAFTIQNQLAAGERVVHGYLAMNLKQSGDEVATDFVRLFDMDPAHRLAFSTLGWSTQINTTKPFVGVIDLGGYLDQLQTGSVNLQLSDDVAMDWALYSATVATPKSDPIGPSIFLDGGNILVSAVMPSVAALRNGEVAPSQLTLAKSGQLTVSGNFTQTANGSLMVQIGGRNSGQFGKLSVGAAASLNGILEVTLVDGFSPIAGDQFEIITTGGIAGPGFNNADLFSDLSHKAVWELLYAANSVTARVVSGTPFGDLNGDSLLTAADWNLYISNALTNVSGLTTSQAYFRGDLNRDGANDLADMALFIDAYEAAHGAGSFSEMLANVREPPYTLFLTVLTALGFVQSRWQIGRG